MAHCQSASGSNRAVADGSQCHRARVMTVSLIRRQHGIVMAFLLPPEKSWAPAKLASTYSRWPPLYVGPVLYCYSSSLWLCCPPRLSLISVCPSVPWWAVKVIVSARVVLLVFSRRAYDCDFCYVVDLLIHVLVFWNYKW